ncbi:MAG: hypothetical protein KKG92_13500, partial [Gammaproteobacteria bacterium]|nr:hypothetical protein [Gammaproteobacteria bacterium]
FSDEVIAFENGTATMHKLADAFFKHKTAVNRAMLLLGRKDSTRMEKAWKEYCGESDGFHSSESDVYVLGYNHPDRIALGKQRFRALYSCLIHHET